MTECMDLYVNPKRSGGGSSVAESLYKGLPVVTLPVGDVSAAAGESFRVADYGEMAETILHLHRMKIIMRGCPVWQKSAQSS